MGVRSAIMKFPLRKFLGVRNPTKNLTAPLVNLLPEAHFPSVRLSIDKARPDKLQAVMVAPTFPIQNFASFPLCCYLPVSRSNGTLS